MKFILMLLSVYRITYMIVYENGPLGIFEKLRTFTSNKAYDKSSSQFSYFWTTESELWQNIDEGVNCPYCVSVWISAIVWLIGKSKIIDIFGLAGAWMLLNQIMDGIESNDS